MSARVGLERPELVSLGLNFQLPQGVRCEPSGFVYAVRARIGVLAVVDEVEVGVCHDAAEAFVAACVDEKVSTGGVGRVAAVAEDVVVDAHFGGCVG